MRALRSALFWLILGLTVIPWAVSGLMLLPFVGRTRFYWYCVGWLRFSLRMARAICGVRWQITGMEHLPTAEQARHAVLIACKHQSTWETFAIPSFMTHPIAYVFKRELLRVPGFGWAIGQMDMIPIDRSRRSEAAALVAERGRELFAKGVWVSMFPEGTRIQRGERGVYKAGAARLAIDCGVPIVPMAVDAARCWPRKSLMLRPGLITLAIGPPISSAGRQPGELTAEVEQWIETKMRELDPEAYADGVPTPVALRSR